MVFGVFRVDVSKVYHKTTIIFTKNRLQYQNMPAQHSPATFTFAQLPGCRQLPGITLIILTTRSVSFRNFIDAHILFNMGIASYVSIGTNYRNIKDVRLERPCQRFFHQVRSRNH